ncbi:unnamed protein product [Urochloa humidicola]
MSSSSSSSSSDSDDSSPVPNTLRVATTPAAPTVVHGINIQFRVPIILDLNEANYTAWVRTFSAVFGQYGLGDHIDGTRPPQGDSDWVQNDCAIVSWLYNRLSPDLLIDVSSDADTAYSLCCGVRDLFRSNRSTRSVYLNSEFRTLLQGDLSILAYCTRMKTMADRLGDLGTPITNADLVQNIIRGLNPRFHNYVPHLTGRRRLPAFHKARSMLQMEEHRLDESAKLQAIGVHGFLPSRKPLDWHGAGLASSTGERHWHSRCSSAVPSSSSRRQRHHHPDARSQPGSTAALRLDKPLSPALQRWWRLVPRHGCILTHGVRLWYSLFLSASFLSCLHCCR